jgi:hypothetical protein
MLFCTNVLLSNVNNSDNFNISGFHIVVLFNLSEEKVHIPSNSCIVTRYKQMPDNGQEIGRNM